jgi:hypothetical protein
MSKYGSDQTPSSYGLGFNGTTVCVPAAKVLANTTTQNLYCNPPAAATYVCTADAQLWIAKTSVTPPTDIYLTQAQYDASYGSLPAS